MQTDTFSFDQLQESRRAAPAPDRLTKADAVREAEALLAAAGAEAARLREQARAEGYETGRQEGLAELRTAMEPAVAALSEAVEALQTARDTLSDRMEAHAVALALMLGEKIVAGAMAVEPQRVLDVVKGALRLVADRERVTVVVAPEDLETLRAGIDGITGEMGGFDTVELQADRRLVRGGAIVRTPVGEIDAAIETKLERAREVAERELAR